MERSEIHVRGSILFDSISIGCKERPKILRHCLGNSVVPVFACMEPIDIDRFSNIEKNSTDIMKCVVVKQAFGPAHNSIGLFVEVLHILFILSAVYTFLIITQFIFLKNCRLPIKEKVLILVLFGY